jgi:pachytene checkpoint protein 2
VHSSFAIEVRMQVADCVTENIVLPQPRFAGLWRSIVTTPAVKDRLLHNALLGLELRRKLSFDVTALHGLILLFGPPGTGKTTLARGVAQEMAPLVAGGKVRLIEINPHGLMSAEHGQSQQKVYELLSEHIPLLADDQMPTVVLLDEVESMTVARSAASLSANPADVHRATDAVLASLDRTAADHSHIVTVATSNFTDALDDAFKSRADASIEVPLPDASAIAAILTQTLNDFAVAYAPLASLASDKRLTTIAKRLVGADGRQVRKLITDAMSTGLETVSDPGKLTIAQLEEAITGLGTSGSGGRNAAA